MNFKKHQLLLLALILIAAQPVLAVITVPHNTTTWDFAAWGGTIADPVDEDIEIPNGHNVFFNDITVYLDPGVRIYVRRGGKMVALRCNFESISAAQTWYGFQVAGDSDVPSTDPAQGQLFLKNCHIRNAEIGVRCQANIFYDGGGILVAEDNTFSNCAEWAIQMYNYPFPNASRITGNTFESSLIWGESFVTEAYWGFINIDGIMNLIIEDNQFYNTHAACVDDDVLRGIGIYAEHSSFLAKDNDFFRLWEGIRDARDYSGYTIGSDPLTNTSQIRNNRFANVPLGVVLSGNDDIWVENNTFLVNDNNTQVLDPYALDQYDDRYFCGVSILSGVDNSHIVNNTFRLDIDQVQPGAIDLNVYGIETSFSMGASTEAFIYENTFDYKYPSADVYPNGLAFGMNLGGDAQYRVECNTFDFDGNSTRPQFGIGFENRDVPTAIGTPTVGAGNHFLNFTQCGLTQWALYGGFNVSSSEVDYYDLVDQGTYVPSGCDERVTVVDITGTGAANGCSFPGAPGPIPGSIATPPSLPPYPSSKMAALSTLDFKVYPSVTAPGPVTVEFAGEGGTLQLMDINGAILRTLPIQEHSQTMQLDLSDFPAGMYMLRFANDSGRKTHKLILQ